MMDPLKQLPQPLHILRVCSTAHGAKISPAQMKPKQTLGPQVENEGV